MLIYKQNNPRITTKKNLVLKTLQFYFIIF